jgi:hypothetical protein
MIEKNQGAAERPAWQQVAAFVLLEGAGAAAYQQTGSLLRKTKFFADVRRFGMNTEAKFSERTRKKRGARLPGAPLWFGFESPPRRGRRPG